jgi:hypothetical protein
MHHNLSDFELNCFIETPELCWIVLLAKINRVEVFVEMAGPDRIIERQIQNFNGSALVASKIEMS